MNLLSSNLGAFSLALALLLPTALMAQPEGASIRVAASPCPPFVISEGGELSGLGIFLWDQVSRQMGVEYQISEHPLNEMLNAIDDPRMDRQADVGVSCLSITAERERSIDFSHSFYETHTGVAVRELGTMTAVKSFFARPAVLKGLGFILGAAALVGLVFFLLEHSVNPKLYSMKSRAGRFLEAFIVGMLFVTRGPIRFYEFKTLTARTLSAVLAISSTLLIAAITAVLASAFTLESLRQQVTGLQDLNNVRTGALEASTSSQFLQDNGIAHQTRAEIHDLVFDLHHGHLDAIVADAAVLKYTIKKARGEGKYESLLVLPYVFDRHNYGFALEEGSLLLESVNQALLTVRKSPEWRKEVAKYLGD
jgi:polar amino acid transport system substrate-binding protein